MALGEAKVERIDFGIGTSPLLHLTFQIIPYREVGRGTGPEPQLFQNF